MTQKVSSNLLEVESSLIPDTDVAYDLGSSTNKFRDLYLSGNTITLGDIALSQDADGNLEVVSSSGNTPAKIVAAEVQIGNLVLKEAVDGTLQQATIDSSGVESAPVAVSGTDLYVQLVQTGTIQVTEGDAKWFAPAALTVSQTDVNLTAAGSGTDVYKLKKNGTAVVTFNITAGTTSATDSTSVSMVAGDYLEVEVTSIGGDAGTDLAIILTYTFD